MIGDVCNVKDSVADGVKAWTMSDNVFRRFGL